MARRGWPDLLSLGRPALGTWSQIASEECIDMLGAAGLDFTVVDTEHGAFGIETAERLFRACDANGLVPLVRVARADPFLVGQALDAGAAAIVVPGVSSAGLASAMVAASRFAPDGTRGACPCVRAGRHFITDWPRYVASQRTGTAIIALVETEAGLREIEAICAVEGLGALMIGPFDLSVSLGFAGDYMAAEVQRAIDRMIAAARAHRLPVIAPIFDPDVSVARAQQLAWTDRGASHFVVGTDKILFASAAARFAAGLR
jgi:4-hydroxy-2-oxoheptanedioate aldolase